MPSFNFFTSDQTSLYVNYWEPTNHLLGIVHIAHGMAEHGGRYERVARSLTALGYKVYAADYRGHGQSARQRDDLGFIAEADGWNRIVLDAQELIDHTRLDHPHLPIFLVGHSMGSYVAQQIIYERPTLLKGAVLSAPNARPGFAAQAGRGIARAERLRLGKRGKSQYINSLTFGKFNQQFAPAETPFDWLSRDLTEVKLYFNDSRCGFICSTQLWVDFLDGISELSKPTHKTKIPKDFPIYIFAGSRDPVCENGRGAEALAREYQRTGLKNVSCKIYPEGRHEMLNETNRDEVINDLAIWLNHHLI